MTNLWTKKNFLRFWIHSTKNKKVYKDFFFINNMRGKKGVSGIILTIIMIVLVLAAVVIIWGVITNLLETQSEQIDVSARCLDVNIQPTKITCTGLNGDVCEVTYKRSSSGDEIAGMKFVFTNDAGVTNFIYDVPGDVGLLETSTLTNITTGINSTTNVEIVAYFTDISGNEQLC